MESTSFIPSANFIRAVGGGATIPRLQMRKQAHTFSWLESGDSPGLCDAQEPHRCVPGAIADTHPSPSFVWILRANGPSLPSWLGQWKLWDWEPFPRFEEA